MEAKQMIEEHTKYVQEALEFIGVTETESIQVDIMDGPMGDFQIVQWQVKSKQLPVPVAGSYKLTTAGEARQQVVLSIALIQHRYGWYIYQTIQALDMWMIRDEKFAQHNSLLQVFVRQALAEAIDKMSRSVVKQYVQKEINMDMNFVFIDEQHKAYKAQQDVAQRLINKYGSNGKRPT